MTKYLISSFIALLLAVFCTVSLAFAADTVVGTVTKLRNTAYVIRQEQQLTIDVGFKIYENDEIQSETDTRVELTFNDGTTLYIGANCRLVVDKFLFDPDDNIGIAILRVLQGPFRFISGLIGKVQDPQIVVQTQIGVIAVRGTDFWGGPSRGQYGVLLLKGAISITNPSGQRILTTPGTGVNLTGDNVPPSDVTIWGTDRAAEALAAVAF